MKIYLISIFIVSIALASCHPSRNTIKQSNRDAIVDSIVGTKMDEINKMAMEDLKIRMAIEVKAKADSIVQRYMNPPIKNDSIAKTKNIQPD